jgi:hypothetical protein
MVIKFQAHNIRGSILQFKLNSCWHHGFFLGKISPDDEFFSNWLKFNGFDFLITKFVI